MERNSVLQLVANWLKGTSIGYCIAFAVQEKSTNYLLLGMMVIAIYVVDEMLIYQVSEDDEDDEDDEYDEDNEDDEDDE